MHGLMIAALVVAAGLPAPVQRGAIGRPLTAPDQNAPPVIDIALRMIRVAEGGSTIARSAARGDEQAVLYARLASCVMGASLEDPAHENSIAWRASGRLQSVDRGIAVADIEWQRLDYRPAGIEAGPRVRTTLTLPLGERVAVDVAAVSGSMCGMDGLIFELGVAADHGRRLSTSSEGRPRTGAAGVGGGGGVGRRETPADVERRRQGADAARAAPVVSRPMPPRQYGVDVWLVPGAANPESTAALAQRMSQVIGGTGGRFTFPSMTVDAGGAGSVVLDISALVIPVGGDRLIVAITRHVTRNGAPLVSAGWFKAVPLPKPGDVLSFEIPRADGSAAAAVPSQGGYGLRVRIAQPVRSPWRH